MQVRSLSLRLEFNQHCSEKHLHRYPAEFDFRYNNRIALGINDTTRAELAIQGAAGKRLTYRRTH